MKATEYELWLSDKRENNFRFKLAPTTYKANRTKPLPIHYGAVRKYLEEKWGAQVTPGQEADDALGIAQMRGISVADSRAHNPEAVGSIPTPATIICTIDKDLKQIPGKHYNWVKDEFDEVDYQQGLSYFYEQLLTGDRTDNISSNIKRMGTGTAASLLAYCESEQEMYEIVQGKYEDQNLLELNGKLLWIRRKPNEIWKPPT